MCVRLRCMCQMPRARGRNESDARSHCHATKSACRHPRTSLAYDCMSKRIGVASLRSTRLIRSRPKTHPPREKRRCALLIDVTALAAPWLPSFQVANPVVCATDDELLVRGAHSRRIHVRHAPRALDQDRPPSSSGRTCYCARSP